MRRTSLDSRSKPAEPPRGLNPALYRLLARLGRVDILDEGRPMAFGEPTWDRRTDRLYPSIEVWGESYVTHCPSCRDRNGRLWVSHRWFTVEPGTGMLLTWLIRCKAGHCSRDPGGRSNLADLILGDGRHGYRQTGFPFPSLPAAKKR